MAVTRMDNVGIVVEDMDAAIEFVRKALRGHALLERVLVHARRGLDAALVADDV